MKALLLTAPSTLAIVDFPTPAIADDEVLVRIHACGICGSDLHICFDLISSGFRLGSCLHRFALSEACRLTRCISL